MNKILLLGIAILVSGCVTDSRYGKGDIELSPAAASAFSLYLEGKAKSGGVGGAPVVFVVTPDERSNWQYYYCSGFYDGCHATDSTTRAIEECEEGAGGQKCYVYAVRNNVVWEKGEDPAPE